MDIYKHCELCEHKKMNLKLGSVCGLTDKKPAFLYTCSKIKFGKTLEDQLIKATFECEKLSRSKRKTLIYFVTFLVISIAIVTTGFLLGNHVLEMGVISTIPLTIIAAGSVPFGLAFGTLLNYYQKFEIAKLKKNNIEMVLGLYRIKYKLKINFGNEYHGLQEYSTDFKFID